MKKAAVLALSLGWLPLVAASQTPDGAVDADTMRSAVERVEASRATGDNPGLTQADGDAAGRLKAGGVQSPEISAISSAAPPPADNSAARENVYERPSGNEVKREPDNAAPPPAVDDSRSADAPADSPLEPDAGNTPADKTAASPSDTPDAAQAPDKNASTDTPPDPNADPQAGTAPANASPGAPSHIRRVPRSRTALYRDPRIETLGDDSDEPPRPLTPSAGFERVHKAATVAALGVPPRSLQSFESAHFGAPKSGFGRFEMRSAAAEAPRRIGGGFELADRRPPKRAAARLPDLLATP